MQLIDFFVGGILVDTLILFSVFVAVGSFLGKSSASETASRVAVAVLGWLGCLLGLGALSEALAAFDALVGELFHRSLEGTDHAALNPVFAGGDGYEHAQVLSVLFAVVTNIVFARFTRAKYLFINPLHLLLASALMLFLCARAEVSPFLAVPLVGVLIGAGTAWLAWLAKAKFSLHGDGYVLGTFHTLLLAASRWVAAKWGKGKGPKKVAHGELLRGGPSRSPILFAALVVGGVAVLLSINAGKETSETILQSASLLYVFPSAGSTFFLVGSLLLGFEFGVGLWVLLQCLPLVSSTLVSASGGFKRVLPGVEPALDGIFLFPEAPFGVVLGFLLSFAGGIVGYYLTSVVGLIPIVPGVLAALTAGGVAGVLAEKAGGTRGVWIAAPLHGFVLVLLASVLMTVSGLLGEGAASVELSDVALSGSLLALLLWPFA